MSVSSREIIYVRTDRAEAFEVGELLDVSWAARSAGHPYPVAVSRAAWRSLIAAAGRGARDEQAELHAALVSLTKCVRDAGIAAEVSFESFGTRLTAFYGPGDSWEPVVTIKAPWERRS